MAWGDRVSQDNAAPPGAEGPATPAEPIRADGVPIAASETGLAAKARDLEALRDAVVDAAGVGAGLWLSYLFVLFYFLVAVGGVTHRDLFLASPVKLPFLDVDLPLVGFFVLGPALFLVVHAYLLLHFVLLAGKVDAFDAELEAQIADEEVRARLRRQLPSNIFVQFHAGPREVRTGVVGLMLRLIALISVVAGPIALLVFFQLQFLPYHDEAATWWQRLAVVADLVLLWVLWPLIARGRTTWPRRHEIHRAKYAFLAALSLAPMVLVFGIATYPGEWLETALPSANLIPTRIDRHGLSGWTSLHRILVAGAVDMDARQPTSIWSNRLVLPDFDVFDLGKYDRDTKLADLPYTISLRTRHFEGAVLIGSVLRKADLTGAILDGATLNGIDLQGAKLDRAELQGAILDDAQLQGASLDHAGLRGASLEVAQLQNATLQGAHLQGAKLLGAQLQGADLSSAELQGASLQLAQLQGATLDQAQLQGSSLSYAELRGATLRGAQLQGARLLGAQLQGAQLEIAQLQGASLDHAQLQGAVLDHAQLQGASLHHAQLQGASLEEAQLQGAMLAGAHFEVATLDNAQLQGAILSDAHLEGATLRDAQLEGAVFWNTFVWRAAVSPELARGACLALLRRAAWSAEAFADLRRTIDELVPEGAQQNKLLQRVDRLDPAVALDAETTIVQAWDSLEGPANAIEACTGSLAEQWIAAGCAAEGAPYVASGIGGRLDWDEAPLRDARPLRAAVATAFLGASRCAGAQGIAADLKANLEMIRQRALAAQSDPPRGYGRGF